MAERAFIEWRRTPVVDRIQPLFRLKTLLEEHALELAGILAREDGKTAQDSRMEVRRATQMVEVACGMPSLMMGDPLKDVAREIDGRAIRQPFGVCAGITPFNFPATVPLWLYPCAIACGDAFVLKPSEKVPLTLARVVELLGDSGLSAGVMNLIDGGKEVVDALLYHPLYHPLVKTVSFVGSTAGARCIYATAGGGKASAGGGRR